MGYWIKNDLVYRKYICINQKHSPKIIIDVLYKDKHKNTLEYLLYEKSMMMGVRDKTE